jgi:hypothetical protein
LRLSARLLAGPQAAGDAVPTKRTVIDRPRRRTFSAEVIGLFVELDRQHLSNPYADGPRALAERLGLMNEYWSGNSVLDRGAGPCHPAGYVAHEGWFTCRQVREELLSALSKHGGGKEGFDKRSAG